MNQVRKNFRKEKFLIDVSIYRKRLLKERLFIIKIIKTLKKGKGEEINPPEGGDKEGGRRCKR